MASRLPWAAPSPPNCCPTPSRPPSPTGPAPQDAPGYYPPALTGLRGSHPGAYEAAHRLRDGDFWSQAGNLKQTDEDYDLIVVGGGISGLAAAHFYRAKHQDARILILDNHDDFGGHAKRNEFSLNGRIELINGGTLADRQPAAVQRRGRRLAEDAGHRSRGAHGKMLARRFLSLARAATAASFSTRRLSAPTS